MEYFFWFQTLLSGAVLLICILLFRKIRKIHLATFELLDAGREIKVLFSQFQSLLALERTLGLSKSLPPVRGWAGSPDFLLVVSNQLLSRKPDVVMECSSGVSTLVIARCLQLNQRGHVYSLEHEKKYAEQTKTLLSAYGLSSWATVLFAPLETINDGFNWYSISAIPDDLPPVDILVVDGPPATTNPLARYPALPKLISRMAGRGTVILDDTARADEAETIKRWIAQFPGIVTTDCNCEKGCVILELNDAELGCKDST